MNKMKKYIKLITLIAIATIIFAIAVTSKTISLSDKTTFLEHGKYTNLEAQKNFIENYQQDKSGQWQKIVYTYEGNPVFYIVYYNEKTNLFTVYVDTRQDSFSKQGIHVYSCKKIKTSSEDYALNLIGCNNSPNGKLYIP
jgi:hypothetical protein